MAITYVGGDTGYVASGTGDVALTLPTVADDDFAIAWARADEAGAVTDFSITEAGWTQLTKQNPTTGRDSVEQIFYKKLTTSDTTVTVETGTNEQHGATVMVFRGVDATTAFDVTFSAGSHFDDNENAQDGPNPAITTATDNAAVILLQGLTGASPVSAWGLPSGFTQGETQIQTHASFIVAYDLDAGTAGTVTPGSWSHTVTNNGAEERLFTLALRPAGGAAPNTGTASTAVDLAVTAEGSTQHAATAATAVTVDVAADGATQHGGNGAAGVDVALTAAGQTSAAGTSALPVTLTLAAIGQAPTGIAEGTAAIEANVTLAAAGTADHTGTAGLDTSIDVSAVGATSHTGTSAAVIGIELTASGSAPSTSNNGSADLPIGLATTATGATDHTGTADAVVGITIAAAGKAGGSGTAAAFIPVTLEATGAAPATGTAAFTLNLGLAATNTPQIVGEVTFTPSGHEVVSFTDRSLVAEFEDRPIVVGFT